MGINSSKLLKKKLLSWLVPFGIAILLFVLARPAFAELMERENILSSVLPAENIEVGVSHDENGNPQIYYDLNGQKTVVTTEIIPHAVPSTDEKYIVWMSLVGQYWQIFLHDIITQTTIQLTYGNSNSVNPKIAEGQIIWEGQVEGVWQIFLYDSGQIKQLTTGDQPSLNSDLEGNFLVYSTKEDFGKWKSFAYDISKKEQISLTPGSFTKKPILKNGEVYWNDDDGERKAVMVYDLQGRGRRLLSQPDAIEAYGLRIEGEKVKWFERIPDPPEPEEANGPEVAGAIISESSAVEEAPAEESAGESVSEEVVEVEQPIAEVEAAEPAQQEETTPSQSNDEEELIEPVPVSEEEVAEELGAVEGPPPEDELPAETGTAEDERELLPEPESAPSVIDEIPLPEQSNEEVRPLPEPVLEQEPEPVITEEPTLPEQEPVSEELEALPEQTQDTKSEPVPVPEVIEVE